MAVAASGPAAGTPAAGTGPRGAHAGAPRARRELPALDGLRAVAATLVLLTHAAFATGAYGLPGLGPLLARFDFGVALFFVLSGFLLTRPWVAHRAGGRAVDLRRYALHRAVRILPAYWIALAAVLATTARGAGAGAAASNAALAQIYTLDLLPGFTQTWSLATEVSFYAVLPLAAAAALGRRGSPRRALAVLAAASAACWAWVGLAAAAVLPPQSGMWLPGHADWFAAGMALAVAEPVLASSGHRAAAALRDLADRPASTALLVAALAWLLSTPVAGPLTLLPASPAAAVVKEAGYALVALLVVGAVAWAPPGSPPARVLGSPAARAFGRVSYAVFLWHVWVLEGVRAALGVPLFGGRFVLVAALTLAVSLAVAAASWRLVERPLLGLVGARTR